MNFCYHQALKGSQYQTTINPFEVNISFLYSLKTSKKTSGGIEMKYWLGIGSFYNDHEILTD